MTEKDKNGIKKPRKFGLGIVLGLRWVLKKFGLDKGREKSKDDDKPDNPTLR